MLFEKWSEYTMCKHVYLSTISAIKIRAQIPCQHKNILLGLLFKAQPHFTSTSIHRSKHRYRERAKCEAENEKQIQQMKTEYQENSDVSKQLAYLVFFIFSLSFCHKYLRSTTIVSVLSTLRWRFSLCWIN